MLATDVGRAISDQMGDVSERENAGMDMKKLDVVSELATHVAKANYEYLGPRDVASVKRCILDTLGCAFAGSSRPPFPELVNLFRDQGGKPEATIISYGVRVPLRNAVLVNSAMARALDLDDVYEAKTPTHASVVAVPAALGAAERKHRTSGKDMILAVALGQDLMIRMARACNNVPMAHGRSVTGSFGSFAAAATVAKVFRFDADKIVDSMGNAYCQTAAEMQCFHDGALSQRVHQGLSTSNGVFAAVLADVGVTGSRNVLEGKHGYYNLWEGGDYDRSELTADLGRKFHGTELSVKPFPCCKGTHGAMEAALTLTIEHDIKPQDVAEIIVTCPSDLEDEWASVGLFEPGKAEPKGDVEAKFSTLWGVGVVVATRAAWIDDFTMQGVRAKRDTVVPMSSKVRPIWDKSMRRSSTASMGPVSVEIKMNNGSAYTRSVEHVKGSPQNPFTWEDMVKRFTDCVQRSSRPVSGDAVKRIIQLVYDLDKLDDVSKLAQALA